MPRGYRCIILAAFGGLILAAGHAPKKPAQGEERHTGTQITNASPATDGPAAEAAKPIEPPEYYQPCGKRGSESNSDLCAQWSAAKAAGEAAKWAYWQLWLSGLGVLGLGITLWFNFRALRLAERESEETKGALAIAARNAEAAEHAITSAREMAILELRARIVIVVIKVSNFKEKRLVFAVKIRNFGKTYAHDIRLKGRVGRLSWPADFSFPIPDEYVTSGSDAPLAGGADTELYIPGEGPDPEFFEKCARGDCAMMIKGVVTYRDEFNRDRNSFFNVYCGGDAGMKYVTLDGEENIVNVAFAPTGNHAD